jgi:hypothetical protein
MSFVMAQVVGRKYSAVFGYENEVDASKGRDPNQEGSGARQEVVLCVRGELGESGRLFWLAQALRVVTVLVIINALQPDKSHDSRADQTAHLETGQIGTEGSNSSRSATESVHVAYILEKAENSARNVAFFLPPAQCFPKPFSAAPRAR